MKIRRLIICLLLPAFILSLTAHSCGKEPEKDPQENTDPENPGEDPGENPEQNTTYKFVVSPLKGKWDAGDQIYVHGNIGSWAEVVTLTADDISADGKTATAKLGEVTERQADPDGLYAAWPDEAVKHVNTKTGAKTSFQSCDRLLTVAYLQGDTFTFVDASSSLAFTVDGDYDNYALAANNRKGLIVTNLEVEHTSQHTTFNQKQNTGYPYLYGNVQSGKKVQIWMPGTMTLRNGFTLFLGKGDNWTAAYKVSGDVNLLSSECKDMGNITSSLEAYNGPAPRMPEVAGKPTKYLVKFNELSGICLSEDENFMWGVGDDGELAQISFTGEVLSSLYIGGDAEDVSRNRETGDLLIGLEPDGVGIIKGPDFNSHVSTLFNISACSNYGNSGIEGIAYYKDGKVFAGAQSNSHLFLCDLATKKVEWNIKPWDKELLSEVGGLCYDPKTDWLWVIDSESKMVFVLSAERLLASEANTDQGKVYDAMLGAYPVSEGSNPESVCVDHKNSCFWMGDDYGDNSYLYRYDLNGLDDFNLD